jgi:hypothetical protein
MKPSSRTDPQWGEIRWLVPRDVASDLPALVLVVGVGADFVNVAPVHEELALACDRDIRLFPRDMASEGGYVVIGTVFTDVNPAWLSARSVDLVRDLDLVNAVIDLACSHEAEPALRDSQSWRCGTPLPSVFPPFAVEDLGLSLEEYWAADPRYEHVFAVLSRVQTILEQYEIDPDLFGERFWDVIRRGYSREERQTLSSLAGTGLLRECEWALSRRKCDEMLNNPDALRKLVAA